MINIEQLKNILRYRLKDSENGAVVYFTLDLDKYELIITGETTASYKWVDGTKETFIDLMLRCSKEYLMDKLSNEEFDNEASIEKTIANMKAKYDKETCRLDNDEFKELLLDIEDIYAGDEWEFDSEVCRIFDDLCVQPYFEDCISRVCDFPYWIRKSIDYFCKHIKPLLKEVQENE